MVDYSTTDTPDDYICDACGVAGIKLWRLYQTFLSHQRLLCARCACDDQGMMGPVGADGRLYDASCDRKTDAIGWYVPAVPTEDDETFWGYTSVPQAGVDWWRSLPTEPTPSRAEIARLRAISMVAGYPDPAGGR